MALHSVRVAESSSLQCERHKTALFSLLTKYLLGRCFCNTGARVQELMSRPSLSLRPGVAPAGSSLRAFRWGAGGPAPLLFFSSLRRREPVKVSRVAEADGLRGKEEIKWKCEQCRTPQSSFGFVTFHKCRFTVSKLGEHPWVCFAGVTRGRGFLLCVWCNYSVTQADAEQLHSCAHGFGGQLEWIAASDQAARR